MIYDDGQWSEDELAVMPVEDIAAENCGSGRWVTAGWGSLLSTIISFKVRKNEIFNLGFFLHKKACQDT
jgi:hypothetical protein